VTYRCQSLTATLNSEPERSSSTVQDNNFFCNELVNYFVNHWLSLFPLWCLCINALYHVDALKSWHTNADAENWFSFVKDRHVRGSRLGSRVRMGNFFRKQRMNIEMRLKRFAISSVRGVPSAKRERATKHTSQEQWGRNGRAKYARPTPGLSSQVLQHSTASSDTDTDMDDVSDVEPVTDTQQLPAHATGATEAGHDSSYCLIMLLKTGHTVCVKLSPR